MFDLGGRGLVSRPLGYTQARQPGALDPGSSMWGSEHMGAMPGRAERLQMAQYTDKAEDADTVIHALKKAVFRGRIRMTEFFSDFDPLRTGYMSAGKFRTALEACGAMPLNERQMQVLTLRYIDPTDDQRVRYLDLLQEIEKVFTTADMQYDPHSAAVDFTPNLIKEGTMLPPAPGRNPRLAVTRAWPKPAPGRYSSLADTHT